MSISVAIIGGGITGLAAAAWLQHDHGVSDAVVFEASKRAGGKVYTETKSGHLLEWGPQGFLDNAEDTLELVRLAGIESRLVRCDEASTDRFILRRGLLRSVPLSPLSFLGSDILPLRARLRVLCEPFARRRPEGDESVFDFARRRIGRQAAEVLVDAMVTGVFAGDSRELSLAATFPRMAQMEAAHGSLTRAMLARQREARKAGGRSGGPAGPGGTLSTFDTGMGLLPEKLGGDLGNRLRLAAPVQRIEIQAEGFRLQGDGFEEEAEVLLLTTGAAETAELLRPWVPEAAVSALQSIPVASIAVVMASYADPDAFGLPLDGFGFLVPATEQVPILGTLFCHSIFPSQAPDGRLLLRTMLGGARDPAAVELDDSAMLERVRSALRLVFGRDPEPDQVWYVRHPRGITQYSLGHLERVETAERAAAAVGIELAGSAYRGVSVNDCIKQARVAAARIAARLTARVEKGAPATAL